MKTLEARAKFFKRERTLFLTARSCPTAAYTERDRRWPVFSFGRAITSVGHLFSRGVQEKNDDDAEVNASHRRDIARKNNGAQKSDCFTLLNEKNRLNVFKNISKENWHAF